MAATIKIPVYSLNELKSTTDDAIGPYLMSLPQPYTFIASNMKSNVRLSLGYLAVCLAAVTFYVDYTQGWKATTLWITPAVATYFILNLALTIWVWGFEAGLVFQGSRGRGERIYLNSSVKKHAPLYNLHVQYTSPSGHKQEKTIAAPFAQWFTAPGIFRHEQFRQWLTDQLPILTKKSEN